MAVQGDQFVWELRTTGSMNNGAGFAWKSLVNATYKWTASGSGTNEYYCELVAGGDPGLTRPYSCYTDNNYNLATAGTLGALAAGQWAWGDNDSLGYSTVYVRLADGTDPDTKRAYDWIGISKSGGLDYSQQDSPHLVITDLVIGADNTTVTSALTPFDAYDANNGLKIVSGLNFTVGWYEVISVAAGVATLDRACGTATSTGGVANLGGAGGVPTDAFFDPNDATKHYQPGQRIFMKAGTYTFTGTVDQQTADDGTSNLPIWIIGYNTIRGDDPIVNNMPHWALGAYYFAPRSFHIFKNLSVIGSGNFTIGFLRHYITLQNIRSIHNYNTAGGSGLGSTSGSSNSGNIINCESVSWRGYAFRAPSGFRIINCYGHDSDGSALATSAAFYIDIGGNTIINSIGVGSQNGLYFGTTGSGLILNNIFDDNQQGIYMQNHAAESMNALNNIITNNKVYGAQNTVRTLATLFDYNIWYGNTTLSTLVDLGKNEIIGSDPLFVNPSGTLIDACESTANWSSAQGAEVTIALDNGTPGTTHKVGSNSVKVTQSANAAAGLLAYMTISSTNMSTWAGLHFWIKTDDTTYSAGDLQILLSDQANCTSPIVTYAMPAMTANTWYKVWLHNDPTGLGACTGIITIGLSQPNDEGAGSIWIDEIRGGNRDFTLSAGSPASNSGYTFNTGDCFGLAGTY
jgi:hypothetical protein